VDEREFQKHYNAWRRGNINRRQFMAVTGLGAAAAIMAACAPGTGASQSAAPSAEAARPGGSPRSACAASA